MTRTEDQDGNAIVTDDARIITPGAERMRLSRERRRQGDVMVSLKVGPNMTANLAELGWTPTSDRIDKDTIARALAELIDHAIKMRVTPGPLAVGLDKCAGLSPKLGTQFERGGPHDLGLGPVQPGEVLGEVDVLAGVVEDKPPAVQPCDRVDTPDIVVEHAELSRLEPCEAQPWAERTQPFEVESARLWGQRLTLWQRWRMWAPEWGPRPDQDGCQAPDYLS
jgi:hypothetical protein